MKKREIHRVGVLVRVSTEEQVAGGSPEHHEFRGKAYAESKRWEVVTVYRLLGVSGKDVMQHPEMLRMLEDLRAGRIDALIFSKFARLARNAIALHQLAEIFREHEAHLISLDEAVDTSTPAGRMLFGMIASLAEWEREEISSRVAASVVARAKMGKHIGGSPPFGYQWVDGKLEPHPDTAPVRALIYELYLQHQRLRTVARILNERGYRSRKGTPFTDSSVRHILQDPTAKGERRANYTLTPGRNRGKHGRKPEEEWILQPCPAIVPAELWDACNAILSEREEVYRKRGRTTVTMFGSLVHCRCGDVMYIDTPRKAYRCRRHGCGGKITGVKLEALFRAQFEAFFCSPEALEAFAAQERPQLEVKQELLAGRRRELAQLGADLERITKAFLGGYLPAEAFGEYHREFGGRRRKLEREIATLMGEVDYLKVQNLSHQQAAQDAGALAARWDEFNDGEKAIVIRSVTERIIVHEKGVTLHLLYSPGQFQLATDTSFEKALNGCGLDAFSNSAVVELEYAWPEDEPPPPPPLMGSWREHLAHARRVRGLTLTAMAQQLGVQPRTIFCWEHRIYDLHLSIIPRAVEFLGYVPAAEAPSFKVTPGERLEAGRRLRGWSKAKLAQRLGVSTILLRGWEENRSSIAPAFRQRLEGVLKLRLLKPGYETAAARQSGG